MAQTPFQKLHEQLRHHIVNSLGWSSLRDVQEMAIEPVLDGANTVILAPTAGGKTEAAFFPLMSRMLDEEWDGLSLLYLSPIKALLNNQFERLEKLFGLIGYTVGVWHGDISESKKKRMRKDPPHVLLTTPESLEGMLISTRVNRDAMFGDLQAVVIDEIHAFAGDDRGWHLLGVLLRLSSYAGRDIQRLGLSATVGNPPEIASWLSSGSSRPHATIDPEVQSEEQGRALVIPKADAEVKLDWVGNLENAAKVISMLDKGKRRLTFCDSRIQAEKLARALRGRGVTTHLSHSSLSADERRQTERAFHQGGSGVIVATSALELGIDIGSLDRVIQIDSPHSVASFLQRMGRTGRRPGSTTNCLFLTITDEGLLRAAAILDMWRRGEVEPSRAPSNPYHILAQQMMALVLERAGLTTGEFLEAIEPFRKAAGLGDDETRELLKFLLRESYLFTDGVRLGVGRAGEDELGRRNFLELVSVFTTPPLFKVMSHRKEIGTVHQTTFVSSGKDEDKRTVILLAGRSWLVTSLDWDRRIAYVEPFDMPGKTRWLGLGHAMSGMLARAHRRVLTGSEIGEPYWSKRARNSLNGLRQGFLFLEPDVTTVLRREDEVEVWNFAGGLANNYLCDALRMVGVPETASNGLRIVIDDAMTLESVEEKLAAACGEDVRPNVAEDHPMLNGLKFAELLPHGLLQAAGRSRVYGQVEWPLSQMLPIRCSKMARPVSDP